MAELTIFLNCVDNNDGTHITFILCLVITDVLPIRIAKEKAKCICFILHQHCSIVCPTWVTNNKWKLQFSVLKWLSMLNNCCLFCPMHINGSLKFKKIKSNPFIKYIWSKKSQFSPWNRQIICWEVFIFVLKMYYSTI